MSEMAVPRCIFLAFFQAVGWRIKGFTELSGSYWLWLVCFESFVERKLLTTLTWTLPCLVLCLCICLALSILLWKYVLQKHSWAFLPPQFDIYSQSKIMRIILSGFPLLFISSILKCWKSQCKAHSSFKVTGLIYHRPIVSRGCLL